MVATTEADALIELRAPIAAAHGVHAVVQGTYGEVGNLELIVPDPDDGLWVYWRNNDPHDVRPGAVAGGWSNGLRFGRGARYDTASVLQSRHGPANIEVLAQSDGVLHRIFWNSATGFSAAERIGRAPSGGATLIENEVAPNDLFAVSLDFHGLWILRGDVTAYPVLRWYAEPRRRWDERAQLRKATYPLRGVSAVRSNAQTLVAGSVGTPIVVFQETAEGSDDASAEWLPFEACSNPVILAPAAEGALVLELVFGHTEGGLVLLERSADGVWSEAARIATGLGRVDAIAACRSNLRGGQIEIVARTGQTLHHGSVGRDGSGRIMDTPFSPIETHAWIVPSAADAGDPCRS